MKQRTVTLSVSTEPWTSAYFRLPEIDRPVWLEKSMPWSNGWLSGERERKFVAVRSSDYPGFWNDKLEILPEDKWYYATVDPEQEASDK